MNGWFVKFKLVNNLRYLGVHDSIKAENHLKEILPDYLRFLKDEGYECGKIV